MPNKVVKTEAEWRAELSPEQYRVLREKGTEAPWTGEYDAVFEPGTLPLRGLRRRALRVRREVQLRLRLAGVLRAGRRGGDRRGDRRLARHGAHRSDVRRVRRAPRARVPGRPAPDGAALLHQLGSAEAGGGVMEQKATFGAGCFWGVEAAFRRIDGVTKTRVGYAGGQVDNPTYEQVCRDNTGHAEVVEVTYDAEKVPYEQLLAVFWAEHDPTQVNRQGPGRRLAVPLGDLHARRGAARCRRGLTRAGPGAARPAGRDHDRGRAAVLGGRGLPPAVPREARPLELHAAPRRRRVSPSRAGRLFPVRASASKQGSTASRRTARPCAAGPTSASPRRTRRCG